MITAFLLLFVSIVLVFLLVLIALFEVWAEEIENEKEWYDR